MLLRWRYRCNSSQAQTTGAAGVARLGCLHARGAPPFSRQGLARRACAALPDDRAASDAGEQGEGPQGAPGPFGLSGCDADVAQPPTTAGLPADGASASEQLARTKPWNPANTADSSPSSSPTSSSDAADAARGPSAYRAVLGVLARGSEPAAPQPPPQAPAPGGAAHPGGAAAPTPYQEQWEWHVYDAECFQVLDEAVLDTAAAGAFMTQLALADAWGEPLTTHELLHAARVADISGFALPPLVASQLQRLVAAAGPAAAAVSADALLAVYDLPALLEVLHGLEVTPSVAWTDYALHRWLGDCGSSSRIHTSSSSSSSSRSSTSSSSRRASAAMLCVSDVRRVMALLESLYVPDAEPLVEPPPPAAPTSSALILPTQPHRDVLPPILDGAPGPPSLHMHSSRRQRQHQSQLPPIYQSAAQRGAPQAESYLSAAVRRWLDGCIGALLDSGGLARGHQREELYCLLPQLATTPSADLVERLAAEAWPPTPPPQAQHLPPSLSRPSDLGGHSGGGGGGAGGGGGGLLPSAYSSPEAIASFLWIVAASGAQLTPDAIQRELRSLELALMRMALATDRGSGGSSSSSSSSSSNGNGSSSSRRGGPAPPPRRRLDGSSREPLADARAVASLSAAFSLPSAPESTPAFGSSSGQQGGGSGAGSSSGAGAGGGDALPPVVSPFAFVSLPGSVLAPPPPPRRLTPHSAYLSFWAFHHYRYTPSQAGAAAAGPLLLHTALGGTGGAGLRPGHSQGLLGARQRCRLLRSLLLCFRGVQHQLRAPHRGWASLFVGWEELGSGELLALLQDMAVLARLRARGGSSSSTSGDGRSSAGGGSVGGGGLGAEAESRAGAGGAGAGMASRMGGTYTWDEAADVLGADTWWCAGGDAADAADGASGGEHGQAAAPPAGAGAASGLGSGSSSSSSGDEMAASFARFLRESAAGHGRTGGGSSSSSGRGAGGGAAALHVQLSTLAAFVLQLPGWPERFSGLDLPAAAGSLASLLEILWSDRPAAAAAAASTAPGAAAAAAGSAAAAAVDAERQLVADTLADWLSRLMPVIEGGVREATAQDWGSAGAGSIASSSSIGSVASASNSLDERQLPGLLPSTPPPSPSPERLAPPAHARGLTAAEVTATLMALSGTAAALAAARGHAVLHRQLMWAVQRLGSRAARFAPQPASFARVPEMLMRLDSLGWVSAPLEWADAVVDAQAAASGRSSLGSGNSGGLNPGSGSSGGRDVCAPWFRRLAWREALRCVLACGRLVDRARAEVLRRHGDSLLLTSATATTATTATTITTMATTVAVAATPLAAGSGDAAVPWSTEPAGVAVAEAAAAAPPQPPPPPAARPSRAEATLAATLRLRSHLLSNLAARAGGATAGELRQAAATWQVYGLPYDRDAMAALLGAMAAAAPVRPDNSGDAGWEGGGSAAGMGAGAAAPLRDGVARLLAVCQAARAPAEEMEALFGRLGSAEW